MKQQVLYICSQCLERYHEPLETCPNDGAMLRRFSMTQTDEMIGSLLDDRWIIEEKIGEGGMGSVYRAQQINMDRKVAIKTMHSKLADGEGQSYLDRFLREANLASKINHPHLVSIHDFGQTPEGLLFIVMEYLEGLSLAQVLRQTRLTLDQVLTISSQLCQALAVAHQNQVVHRDLKPENIFLIEMPDNDIFIKILDFGIAKNMDTEQRMTQTGQVFGTPEYMSPEQCRGSSKIDQRSDLYSLGCILYELVTGFPPFQGESMLKVLFKHVSDEVPKLQPNNSDAAQLGELIDCIEILLEKKPKNRHQTALDVKRILEAIQNAAPLPQLRLPAWTADVVGQANLEVQDTVDFEAKNTAQGSAPPPYETSLSIAPDAINTINIPDVLEPEPKTSGTNKGLFIGLAVLMVLIVVGGLAVLLQKDAQTAKITPPEIVSKTIVLKDKTINTKPIKVAPEVTNKTVDKDTTALKTAPKTDPKTNIKTNPQTDTKIDSKAIPLIGLTAKNKPTKKTNKIKKVKKATRKKSNKLSPEDDLRVSFGKRPKSEINAQTQQLGNKLRRCVDSAVRERLSIKPDSKNMVHIYANYTVSASGKIQNYFIDPNKSTALPAKTKSCIKRIAASFKFKSAHAISAETFIKSQRSSYTVQLAP